MIQHCLPLKTTNKHNPIRLHLIFVNHHHRTEKNDYLFNFLTNEKKGFLIKNIKWNFTKFLIDRKGIVRKRYPPTAAPSAIEKDLKKIFNFLPEDFENTF